MSADQAPFLLCCFLCLFTCLGLATAALWCFLGGDWLAGSCYLLPAVASALLAGISLSESRGA